MLTIFTADKQHTCEGFTRREFLQVGTLGFGGLTLANLFSAAHGSEAALVRDKAVVVLNLQGGPSQMETFDPKMEAPAEYRPVFGDLPTKLPGVRFGKHFPGLSSLADRLAIVRCFRHGISTHEKAANFVMAGGNPDNSNMASVFASVAGMTNPQTGMPQAAILTPPSVGEEFQGLGTRFDDFVTVLGSLSAAYKPFDPSDGGELLRNMQLRISESRLSDRRALLARLDEFKRKFDGTDALRGADRFDQQAFDVILGGVSDAFNLQQEDPAVVERYDTGMFTVSKALQKKRRYAREAQPISLGKQLLLARRLVEADCRFVTVTSAGWDHHGNRNNFSIAEGIPILAPAVDKAATAFLQDLEDRGLSDKVLLVIMGEFGRTPQLSETGGRGHWGDLCPLIFAGGGLPMGQVIGRSDNRAGQPQGQVVTASNLFATIMHTLIDPGQLRLVSSVPRAITQYFADCKPIPQLT